MTSAELLGRYPSSSTSIRMKIGRTDISFSERGSADAKTQSAKTRGRQYRPAVYASRYCSAAWRRGVAALKGLRSTLTRKRPGPTERA